MKTIISFPLINVLFPFLSFTTMCIAQNNLAGNDFEKDIIKTSKGDLAMTFIGHASLLFEFNNLVIHIDPTMQEADYSKMPKGDLILITHEHYDHFDLNTLKYIIKENTKIILTDQCINNAENLSGELIIMKNGDKQKVYDLDIKAIPAYNIKHTRADGNPFHPKGDGNGYIITFGDKQLYIAGDTENIPEMKELKNIDVAFLPMNLPYTMTPEMVADAAKAFKPKILYPYHYGSTDTNILLELMKEEIDVEVRIRDLQ